MVKSASATVAPELTVKTVKAPPPSRVTPAAGPVIVIGATDAWEAAGNEV